MAHGSLDAEVGPLAARTAQSTLTRLATGEPCAVLLVDLSDAQVIYANDLARQLAPNIALPADVAAWSQEAGLRDAGGRALEATATPLARVAAGAPVDGELVTASRESDVSHAREDLWVVGTPLSDAPEPLAQRALVVFLPLRDVVPNDLVGADGSIDDLRHRAVLASETSFTISDPSDPDNPLVWVNPAFERTTGYTAEAVIGRNCRFLQGPLTDRDAVARIKAGLAGDRTIEETLLNYRADGTVFWNHLVISPVFDADGRLTHHVGVQTDVTERIEADAARDAALAVAEAAVARQRTIAAISAELAEQSARPDQFVDRMTALVASNLRACVGIVLVHEDGDIRHTTVRGADETHTQRAAALADRLSAARPQLRALVTDPAGRWPVTLPEASERPDSEQLLVAPMRIRGRVDGLLVVGVDDNRFDDADDIGAITDIAMRCATALDNARLYATERDTALTLQRSLLPTMPPLERFDVAAAYVPAAEAEVGGDWFDVLELPGPWIGVTVGDVAGHDIAAAAQMGQLRSMVRTLAWEGHRPREVVTKLDGLVRTTQTASLATLLYAVIDDPVPDAGTGAIPACNITYASAGHLPALLRSPDGALRWLDDATTSPVGVADDRVVSEVVVDMPVGATLVLYTDGLVERRDADLDSGLQALADVVAGAAHDSDAQDLRDVIVERLIDVTHADDTCVLVIRRRL